MLLFSSQQAFILTKLLIERGLRMHEDCYKPILRHEHIHLFPPSQEQGARQRTLKIA